MQRHEVVFDVGAPPHRVWRLFHPKVQPDDVVPRTITHPGGSITILKEGDDDGAGLVRTATFPVPRWLLSGGRARSFEVVVEARRNEYARYHAEGKPLWSHAEGWHTLEPKRQAHAKAVLEDLAAQKLSTDSYEIVTKTLGAN